MEAEGSMAVWKWTGLRHVEAEWSIAVWKLSGLRHVEAKWTEYVEAEWMTACGSGVGKIILLLSVC